MKQLLLLACMPLGSLGRVELVTLMQPPTPPEVLQTSRAHPEAEASGKACSDHDEHGEGGLTKCARGALLLGLLRSRRCGRRRGAGA